MNKQQHIGIDLGGTNIRAGLLEGKSLSSINTKRINAKGTADEVLNDVFELVEKVFSSNVGTIGIGVPGLVDLDKGEVFDVINIPSWKHVALRQILEEKFGVQVFVNNDANCFALGEYHFGKGQGSDHMIGLTIGSGLGTGIIINRKLYAGKHCGAGEFGMMDYKDHYIEYYASGQFFRNVHNIDGELAYKMASDGDRKALGMYDELGTHLGNAIKRILYALDIDRIILGGSVRYAYPFFHESLWNSLGTFAYGKTIDTLKIEISELENAGLLGAAALHLT